MKRTFAVLTGLATTLGLLLVSGQASAAPAPQPRVEFTIQSQSILLDYFDAAGNHLGSGAFRADPSDTDPGDAIMACDFHGDGWGIETQLDINPGSNWDTDRYVNTRGHASDYCTDWKPGNIEEETPVAIRVCLVKSGASPICSAGLRGKA